MKATENANRKPIPKWVKIFLSIFIPAALLLAYPIMWFHCTSRDFMINTVEKRYGVELELIDVVMSHGFLPYFNEDYIIKVCPEGGDREKDMFYITRKKGDINILPNSVHDTYLTIYLRDDVEQYLSDIIDDYFDEFHLYTDVDEWEISDKLNLNSTVEEYLSSLKGRARIYIMVYVPNDKLSKEEVEKRYNELSNRFSLLKINAYFSLKYYRTEDYNLIILGRKPQQKYIEWYDTYKLEEE